MKDEMFILYKMTRFEKVTSVHTLVLIGFLYSFVSNFKFICKDAAYHDEYVIEDQAII